MSLAFARSADGGDLLFLAIGYCTLSLFVWLACWQLARGAFARFVVRSRAKAEERLAAPDNQRVAHAYRRVDGASVRLTIGALPHGEELWAVAYLRDGLDAVRELLVARAFLEGFLAPVPWIELRSERETRDRILQQYLSALGRESERSPDAARERAREVAESHQVEFAAVGAESGLTTTRAPWTACLILALPTACLLGLGVASVALRIVAAPPDAGGTLNEVKGVTGATMTGLVLGTWAVLARFLEPSGPGAVAYLAWLRTVTPDVRAQLKEGAHLRAEDAALAIAVNGWEVVRGDPRFPEHFLSRFVHLPSSRPP